ncbi:interferon alpha-5-like [Elgaria multicarinata webbii]|uniref:interferon alpha-5-like n=1 Tax=Elgaria multicarinata webbii TaxID=159646 RepID=UPI002FCD38B8
MATMALHQIGLMLLLVPGIVTLDCNEIVQSQKTENGKTIKLLEAIGGGQQLPLECFYEMPDFGFPGERVLRSSKEDARAAIVFILEQIQGVFWHNFTQADWNVSVADLFQKVVDQQMIQWKKCSVAETGEEATFKDPRLRLRLKRYFIKIHTFLKTEEYSLCAWEAVRSNVLSDFIVLDQLLKSLHN